VTWKIDFSVGAHQQFACLVYHAIGDGRAARRYVVSEERLRSQLQFLKSQSYAVEGFEQLESRLRSRNPLPDRYIVFTIDDGETSALRVADLLSEFGYRATFFLTRDRSVKVPGYVRGPEIRELRKRGFSLGTHGTTHRGLSLMREGDCVVELKESKRWLEDVLGENVVYMSLPGGYGNRRTMELAQEQGYLLTGNSNEWMNFRDTMSVPGQVNRVSMRRKFSLHDLRSIVHGDWRFYLWRQVRRAGLAVPKEILGA
jgi:peptidoglycan/xylan/chitin deacetylase (PgdA/CDA1 family)